MVKIEVAKPINFNELITSKVPGSCKHENLNQPNSYISLFFSKRWGNNRRSLCFETVITALMVMERFIENNKKTISNGDFLEITAIIITLSKKG